MVRFEGEMTLLELADVIGAGHDWRGVAGIAYRSGCEMVTTPMRALVDDLDLLPYPERSFEPETSWKVVGDCAATYALRTTISSTTK